MYSLLLLIGLIGYGALIVLGFSHGGHTHSSHTGHGGHVGHGGHGPHPGHAGHRLALPKGGRAASSHGRSDLGSALLRFVPLSPIDIFSTCLGAGLTGRYLTGHFLEPIVGIAALVNGLALTAFLVRPLTNLILNFATKPALGLEGAVAKTAIAASSFDKDGRGIVQLEIDGQLARLLARLEPFESSRQIHAGDELLVLEVDPKRGRCTVSADLISLNPLLEGSQSHEQPQ